MSFNSYATMTPEMRQAVQDIADSRIAQKSSKTIWFNPVQQQYYYASDPTSTKPDYGIAITKPGKLKGIDRSRYNQPSSRQLVGGGYADPNMSRTEADKMRYDVFTDEASNEAVMFYDAMDRNRKQFYNTGDEARFIGAGTITAADYSGISNIMIDQTVLDLITRDFIILVWKENETVCEIAGRETIEVRLARHVFSLTSVWCIYVSLQASISLLRRKRVWGTWLLRKCYSPLLDAESQTEERSAPLRQFL
jgi:hypothetical protein